MNSKKLTILALLSIPVLGFMTIGTAQELEHFEYVRTDANMSIIVQEAYLDDELLVGGDEIGTFTEDGLCAGAEKVPEGGWEALGIAAWSAEAGEDNGFQDGETIGFRIWEREADLEHIAEITRFEVGNNANYEVNGFRVLYLAAERIPDDPVIEVSADAHDFGAVVEGGSEEWIFTVSNRGRNPLVISEIATDDEHFTVDFEEEIEVETGAEAEFTVTFGSDQAGDYEAVLSITSNDPENEVVEIALSGSVVEPRPPMIVLSADNHSFGRVRVGEQRDWVLRITNHGDMDLTVENIVSEIDEFSTDFEGEFSLEANAETEVTVTFEPGDLEVYATDLVITSNDPDNEEVSVRLSGVGVEEGEPPVISVDVEQYFFGAVVLGGEMTYRLMIHNEGGSDLWLYGADSEEEVFFTEFEGDSLFVRSGQSYPLVVHFAPEEDLFYTSPLIISSNDEENPEISVMLGGAGNNDNGRHFQYARTDVNHSLLVMEATLDGEALIEGDEVAIFSERGFCGGADVFNDEDQAGPAVWGDDENTEDIIEGFNQGEAFLFKVWDADQEVEAWAVPEFTNGPRTYQTNALTVVNLEAESGDPQPAIRLDEDRHDFGQVLVDGSDEWTITIRNMGAADLTVESIESDEEAFTTDFEGEQVVGANEALEVTVTFAPTEERDYFGRLTITSDDPDDEEVFVDFFGLGVDEIREPEIVLGVENYFFGVMHTESQGEYVLEIGNEGGWELQIDDVTSDNDEVFTSDFPDRQITLAPGETFELTLTFLPAAEQQYNGTFTIFSDDPGEPELEFPVRGYGSPLDDHFLFLNTDIRHHLMVDEAVIVSQDDERVPLVAGDEIGVFTTIGLCAGMITVSEDEEIAFDAYGADPNTIYRDGFLNNETMSYRFYDRSTGDELRCLVVEIEGPNRFSENSETSLSLEAEAMRAEAQIAVEPEVFNFGPIGMGEESETIFTIVNTGGANLTITGVESRDQVYTHNYEGGETVLEPDDALELTVTFSPNRAQAYEGTILVNNDDPDENDQAFAFHPVGMGSDHPGEFHHYRTGVNQSVLVREVSLGGSPPSIGDEVGLFTPAGMCAGASIVAEPREQLGISAWGDDADTEILIEGFSDGEEMSMRFWDASQNREYEPEVEVLFGDMQWTANGVTRIDLMIEGVLTIIPVDPIDVDEGDDVDFDLELANAEGEFTFNWMNEDDYPNIRDADDFSFEEDDNVATFHWGTTFWDAGEYELQFEAVNVDDEEMRDETTVFIEVDNVNQAPEIVEEVREDVFGDEDQVSLEEDAAFTAIVDCNELFRDLDEDELVYAYNPDVNDRLDQRWTNGSVYEVRPAVENWFGEVEGASLTAIEAQQGRVLRRVNIDVRRDAPRRSLRRTDGSVKPNRDLQVEYAFSVIITAVNDRPVIVDENGEAIPDEVAAAINEGNEFSFNFIGSDVEDDGGELSWAMTDEGELPEGWEFVDNGDGTADFTWTPTFIDARQAAYTPVFELMDSGDLTDNVMLTITVRDVNQNPVIPEGQEIADIAVDEDPDDRVAVADLNDVFEDPDSDAPLAFAFEGAPDELGMSLENDSELSFLPEVNFNIPNGVQIVVTATDTAQGQASDTFMVVLSPVNDPPEAFDQFAPEDGMRLSYDPDSLATLDFAWRAANQNQWELDEVRYYVVWGLEGGEDTLVSDEVNDIELSDIPIQMLADSLNLERQAGFWIEWRVWAADESFFVLAANASFRFWIPPLSVDGQWEAGVPDDYYMSPAYPNPFNASTTIRFGLPRPGQVSISAWDMHGRKISDIVSGNLPAGTFEASWTAERATSGIYLIRIEAEGYSSLQKVILMR